MDNRKCRRASSQEGNSVGEEIRTERPCKLRLPHNRKSNGRAALETLEPEAQRETDGVAKNEFALSVRVREV